jgi:hypothetical protein
MKTTLLAAALLLVCASPALAEDVATSPAQPFQITLPGGFSTFEAKTQTSTTKDGKIDTTNWISKAPTGEAVVITVSTMPAKILDPEKMINSTRDALLASLKATVETDEPVNGAVTSRRLIFKNDAAFLRARLMVDDNRFYQLLYVGRSAEQRSMPTVAQLFQSFQISH